jgi:FkbM family methyltransferase
MDSNYKNYLTKFSMDGSLPNDHLQYLYKLKNSGFEPKVIYDIGSCVLHWTNPVKNIWPDAQIILFDAFAEAEFLYNGYDFHIGVLSDTDDVLVKFYQNNYLPGGNSYYREIGCPVNYFPEENYIEKITNKLDTIVKLRNFPLPDLVKIDVQGAEVDVINGGVNTIKNAKHLIVELQHVEYNKGALQAIDSLPLIEKTLNFKCISPCFYTSNFDGDYHLINLNQIVNINI